MPIYEEEIKGVMYRYYPTKDNEQFDAVWCVSGSGEILGFLIKTFSMSFVREFSKWLKNRDDPVYAATTIKGIGEYLKKKNFSEFKFGTIPEGT